MFAIAMAVQSDGLSVREVFQNIPHDAAGLIVYVLIAAFVGFIWHGSRSRAP
ncbi:MAG: hypothetical protein WEF86_04810 [Gemmatimonadota bacterium]